MQDNECVGKWSDHRGIWRESGPSSGSLYCKNKLTRRFSCIQLGATLVRDGWPIELFFCRCSNSEHETQSLHVNKLKETVVRGF